MSFAFAGGLVSLLPACQQSAMPVAQEPGPMCTRYEVVEFVARGVARQAPYSRLVTDTIGEQPTADPAVVTCVAAVVDRDYDYTRYQRQDWQGYQEYKVRRLANAYEVSLGPRLSPATQ